MTTIPRGLDTLAEAQKMQEAGVAPEQAQTMLYAAIRASETHIAGMQAGIEARFDALETGLNAKIETVSRDVKDLDTRTSAEIKVLGGKIDALETKIDAVDTKVVAFETSLRESIKAVDTGLSRKIEAGETKSDGQVKGTRLYIAGVGLLVGVVAVFAEADLTNLVGLFR